MISGGNLTYRLWISGGESQGVNITYVVILHMISGGNPTYIIISGGNIT